MRTVSTRGCLFCLVVDLFALLDLFVLLDHIARLGVVVCGLLEKVLKTPSLPVRGVPLQP
jgi:hypothetical protein